MIPWWFCSGEPCIRTDVFRFSAKFYTMCACRSLSTIISDRPKDSIFDQNNMVIQPQNDNNFYKKKTWDRWIRLYLLESAHNSTHYICYILFKTPNSRFKIKISLIFNFATDWLDYNKLRIRTSACWLYNAPTMCSSDKQFVVSSCHEKGPRVTVGSETLC